MADSKRQRGIVIRARRFHPIANLLPLTEGEQLDALVEDIRANGLQEPIVIYEGLILDGRNRKIACEKAGGTPRYVQYMGGAPLANMLSANLHHSEKPTIFAQIIERMFPNCRRLEMFARDTPANWDVWGNEVSAVDEGISGAEVECC